MYYFTLPYHQAKICAKIFIFLHKYTFIKFQLISNYIILKKAFKILCNSSNTKIVLVEGISDLVIHLTKSQHVA